VFAELLKSAAIADNSIRIVAMTKDSRPFKVIVVGGGIGGIGCVVECKRRGYDVSMYEVAKVRDYPYSANSAELCPAGGYNRIVENFILDELTVLGFSFFARIWHEEMNHIRARERPLALMDIQ
jgi:glycine/D-amino acid oxidase-like deaminating enzyme